MHPSVNTDALQLTAATTMWALGGALLAGLPVAWTYTVTRRRKEYAQTTAHGLLLLPLSVAGVALLLPSHLAIAVSLAGVFALAHVQGAVRGLADVVYVLVAVCIGIAAARGSLIVGVLCALAFSALLLACSWLDIARRPGRGLRRTWSRLQKRLRLKSNDPSEAAMASDDRAIAPNETRGGKTNAMLRIRSVSGTRARMALERVLGERTRRWELRDATPVDRGTTVLVYAVRVPRTARGRLLDALQQSPQAIGVELR
ncbi:MAG: hypothetical protein U0132_18860 [Gemmatimonadaceae bacterium]